MISFVRCLVNLNTLVFYNPPRDFWDRYSDEEMKKLKDNAPDDFFNQMKEHTYSLYLIL